LQHRLQIKLANFSTSLSTTTTSTSKSLIKTTLQSTISLDSLDRPRRRPLNFGCNFQSRISWRYKLHWAGCWQWRLW